MLCPSQNLAPTGPVKVVSFGRHSLSYAQLIGLLLTAAFVVIVPPLALADDKFDPFETLKLVSVLFPSNNRLILDDPSNALVGLDEIPNEVQTPTLKTPSRDAQGATRINLVSLGATASAFNDLSLSSIWDTRSVLDDDPRGTAPENVYASFVDEASVRKQSKLTDGNEEQYDTALNRKEVKTTQPQVAATDLFFDPPDTDDETLTLRDVVIYTLKNNPDIGIARWQTEDSRFAVEGARAPFRPNVELLGRSGLESVYSESGVGTYNQNRREASIRLVQRLYDFGRSSQLLKRAKALNQSRELAYYDSVEDTVFRATSVYLDLLATSELLENAVQNVEEHVAIVNLVELSYKGGNTSEAELKRATTRLDRARTTAIDFENRLEQVIGDFRAITGLEPGKLVEPTVDISSAERLNRDTIDSIIASHFAVQSFVRDGNSLTHQIKAANRALLPEVNIELTGRYQDNVLGNTDYTTEGRALLSARWNLYDGGAARARTGQLRARKSENEQRIIKLRNELKQEARNIISVLRTTDDKKSIFDEQVESSTRVVDLYFKQFEAGRRTLLELLDAQADLAEAREESIANRFENLSASFASMRFQNTLTPTLADQLQFPTVAEPNG